MKKDILIYFIVCIFVLFLFQPGNLVAGGEKTRLLGKAEKEDLLNRLKVVQAGIKTFEAEFVEERTIASLPKPLMYKGAIYYIRGNLFFMKYRSPIQYILQVKGAEVTIYVMGSGTADIADMSMVNADAGHKDIFDWDPGSFQGQVYSDADSYWFKEANPKNSGAQLNIYLNKKTLLIERFSIIGATGDTTKIALSEKKINQPLPHEILNFSLPKGTKLNRLSPQ